MILSAALALLASLPTSHDFPVFVWCQDHSGSELPAALTEAYGGVNIEGADSALWAREHNLDFYVGHAPGRELLHLQRDDEWYLELWNEFYKTRDTTPLVRQPCLTDPETWTLTRETLQRSLVARDGNHGLALSLGDEVGLTPWGDPFDLCQSKTCTEAWLAWQRTHGRTGSDSELRLWPSTDPTRLAYLDGDAQAAHAWLARRNFHQDVVLQFIERLANEVRARQPGLPVALFGLTGQTAFGGVSIARVLPHLDVLEAYNEGYARELLYTMRDEQKSWCTLFPANGNSNRAAHRLWTHWLRGGNGAIIWSDRELEKNPLYHERLANAVRDVRAVHARFPNWRPEPAGAALLHDQDSLALAWLRDALTDGATWPRRFAGYQAEHGSRERAVNSSLRLLEDCGLLPGTLPIDSLQTEHVERFPILIAVHQLVVTSADEARLTAYLEEGGRLLLRGPFGILGDRDSKGPCQAEARLTERFPRQVMRLAADRTEFFSYHLARVEARDGRVEAVRRELAGLLKTTRAWQFESKPPLPLLIAEQPMPDGSLLVAAIPNLPEGTLPTVELTLSSKLNIEHVYPVVKESAEPHRVRLEAGDALIFLLRED